MAGMKMKKKFATIEDRKKRVACFYRVSTKKQLDGDDIPSQRRSCLEFLESKGWEFVKEYVEKDVSGFKVSANDRDKIQEAKRDAESGVFDVLLCFMFDRLGRKEDETPFVVEWFAKRVEVWSVMEGQQKFENHTDNLTNYIRFWQAGGESRKTSMRVTENHTQMAEDGLFTGGKAAYGYKLVPSGVFNKKGKELFRRVKDEETNEIAFHMYDLVYSSGFGANRIARHLNESNIPSATGKKWTSGTVNFILSNPLYKGYPAHSKRILDEDGKHKTAPKDEWTVSKVQIPELVTVPEHMWDRVQEIRSSRSQENTDNPDIEKINITKSPLLFVGLARCGHCGSPLTTTYNSKKYLLVDGTVQKWRQAKYRCSGKAMSKTDCTGQTIYSQIKIESVVLEELDKYLDQLREVDLTKQVDQLKKNSVSVEKLELNKLTKQGNTLKKELKALTDEVTKSLLGKSSFKPELLNSLIEQKELELEEVKKRFTEVEKKHTSKMIEKNEMESFINIIPVWKEVFRGASHEKQKMMLTNVIDSIIVYRDSVEVNVKLKITDLIKSVHGQYNKQTRSPS
ncbi:recombinase family protein [Paenibacillus sp. GCM10012303]|uniref:recombinase family protein n=1 Tax=Paenibacillus sp. GCM10012303 TaxID=3317340 RepID=UPI00360E6FBC